MPDDKELSEILAKLILDGEAYLDSDDMDRAKYEAKQALLAWRERYAEEARIDELKRVCSEGNAKIYVNVGGFQSKMKGKDGLTS